MTRRLTLLALAILVNTPAVQADSGADIAAKGNSSGAPACASCHGAGGDGMAGSSFPRLAGLDDRYLFDQLDAFRHNRRESTVMGPIAKALSEEETRMVAAYYSGLYTPSNTKPQDKDAVAAGKKLATLGSWTDRGLPACVQCHGENGSGISSAFPALAAQHADYIEAQLKAWQAGTRKNDPVGLMKSVADKLADNEISAVASYYASLPPAAHHDPDSSTPPPLPPAQAHTRPVPDLGEIHEDAPEGSAQPDSKKVTFSPPSHGDYPKGPLGDAVRKGEQIFRRTNSTPLSQRYVGNDQQCANCHIDAGRLADAAPMWAAWVSYPAYRGKNKRVNDIVMRVQGCFSYSMNAQASEVGHPPASDSETLSNLLSYMYWVSSGAPTGDTHMAGRGYPKLKDTTQGFDPKRGEQVFLDNCAVCHGYNGEGVLRDGVTLFPPLWGDQAYNWGAGMHKINTAAAFIKANMPLGKSNSLSDQEAWDVAAFINSMPRPQDPRFDGNLDDTIEKFHKSKYDLYGKVQKAGKGLTQ